MGLMNLRLWRFLCVRDAEVTKSLPNHPSHHIHPSHSHHSSYPHRHGHLRHPRHPSHHSFPNHPRRGLTGSSPSHPSQPSYPSHPVIAVILVIKVAPSYTHHISHLYADDSQVYLAFEINDASSIKNRIESCVGNIFRWMNHNDLSERT